MIVSTRKQILDLKKLNQCLFLNKNLQNQSGLGTKRKKNKWWEMSYPKKPISRTNPYQSSFETENTDYGSVMILVFGVLIFGSMIGLVFLFNWIGENLF